MAPVEEDMKLSDIFDTLLSNFDLIENSTESSGSATVQKRIEDSISLAETAVHRVNELSLFTDNEQIEEVPTGEIKYLLLPALLGHLLTRVVKAPSESLETMQKSQIYLIDFIRLLHLYGVTTVEPPTPFSAETTTTSSDDTTTAVSMERRSRQAAPDIEAEQRRRQTKIERFRRRKELTQKLTSLQAASKQPHAEDEVQREYYLTLLDKWLADTLDSLDQIETELSLLYHMSKMGATSVREDGATNTHKTSISGCHAGCQKTKGSLRPFIITKDDVQKAVFGAGYPSLATVTVDEFYQKRVDQGIFPDYTQGAGRPAVLSAEETERQEEEEREKKAASKEKKEEQDDDEALRGAREWDDWKDDHRRGWGNMQNKG